MSGFIDPAEHLDARIERLECLVLEMLEQINPNTLSSVGQVLLWSLVATKDVREPRVKNYFYW